MEHSCNRFFIFEDPKNFTVKNLLRGIRDEFRAFVYKLRMNMTRVDDSIERKYNVAICAIFKNEEPYIKEWIEFHKIVGVDHFYLYNNKLISKY